ncbi:Dynein heavy chain 14 [Mactra antiquata]
MSEVRGESQASYASSQFSESTVLNQDLGEPDLFVPEDSPFKPAYPTKAVSYANTLQHDRSKTIAEMKKNAGKGDPRSKAEMLMARLVDRPANSQVLKMVNPMMRKDRILPRKKEGEESEMTKRESASVPNTPSQEMPHLQPRPPSGKNADTSSFRTTMFKRDYQRRQNIIKAKQNKDQTDEPILSVNMLHKPKPAAAPGSITSETEQSEGRDDDVFAELEELMGPETEPSVIKQTIDSVGTTPIDAELDEKTVTFGKINQQSPTSETKPSGLMESRDMTKMTEDDIMRVTGEIPIIEKRDRPSSGQVSRPTSSQHPGSRAGSRPGSGTKLASRLTVKKDMSKILTHLKKNMYDDTAPENDDVMHHVYKLRERLGWKTEIPRHAPGCKESMEKLKDIPDNTKDTDIKQDDGDFVYCLPRNRNDRRGRYEPYDLQVVSPNESRAEKVYWTVSASFVTRVVQDPTNVEGESFNIPILWWLWERRLFYNIHNLPVFVKFRKWKTFKMWKKAIRLQKSNKSQNKLYKQLFVANEVLQGCLIHIRSICETASGSLTGLGKGENAICLIKLDKSLTLTLEDFKAVQHTQNEEAWKQLNALRDKIIDIAWESCATVAEMEGITHGIRPGSPKKVKIKVPQDEPKELNSKALRIQAKYGVTPLANKKEDEKKSDKPTYAQIADWRKILNRLASFLRSIDYLVQEMLRRLVVTATRLLLEHLVASYNVTEEEEEKDEVESLDGSESSVTTGTTIRSRPMSRASSVMSKVPPPTKDITESGYVIPHFDFDQTELYEGPPDVDEVLEEIKQQDVVEEFSAPVFSLQLVLSVPQDARDTRTTSADIAKTASSQSSYLKEAFLDGASNKKTVKFEDNNSESDSESGYSDESGEEGDYGEGQNEDDRSDEELAYPEEKKKPTGKTFVSLSPNEFEVKSGIRQIISMFEGTIAQFISMTREPRLAVFCKPPMFDLKLNYDEEEEEERLELIRPWPDLEFMFCDDQEYQMLLGELNTYVSMEMELVKQYATNFENFCVMVDKCLRLSIEESMSRRQWATDEFSAVLAAHTDMIRQMKRMTVLRRVAMIHVHSKNYRESCLPFPENIVNKVSKALPIIAIKRNEDLLTIIKGASKKLDHYPKSVEEFVEHLSFLGKMSSELPALEREFEIVNKLFTIAKDYNVQITDEQLALYQTLGPDFITLKNIILYCDAKKDENIRKFSHDLDTLIYQIRNKLMDLKNQVRDPDLLHIDTNAMGALETIKFLQEEVQSLSVRARSYGSYQERFGSSLSHSKKGLIGEEYMYMSMGKRDEHSAQEIQADLSEVERDLTLRRLLWQSQEEWTKLVDEWTATSFDALPVETLQKNVNRYSQTVFMLEKGLPHNEVVPRLKEKVMDFKQGMPVITSLRNQFLRPRHWQQIERLIGKSIGKDKSFTLGSLLEMNIFKHKEKIQDISTTASNEATLENMLQKIVDLWKNTDFRYIAHPGRDTFIIAGADDIMTQLEDSQVTIGTIRGSRYVGPIKPQVEEWERKLNIFAKTLEEWMACQRNWLYLEQIFSTPDIQKQLKPEYTMFSQVDKSWKDIMRQVQDRPNAMKCATQTGMLETLQFCNSSLEKIQKCLEEYLDSKRLSFPRFYFLSNDELLEILGQSKEPNAVQPHLGKCFGNIKSLEIKTLPRNPPAVHSMTSAEGEVVTMTRSVRAKGAVEMWLSNVEAHMFETVKRHLKIGLADWLGIKLVEWVLKHPGQVVLTVAQIMFNKDVVKSFDQADPNAALKEVLEKMMKSLSDLAGLVSSPIQPYQTMCIEALLTIDVHNRDIIFNMIKEGVATRENFEWTRQLRYEWDETTNNCQVYQSNASFLYGYEYLGCSSRLVITPLTDRCYLTLTGALHLHLGGSPAGPAGTGKTETVKDLAKAMGKQCVVFNCSEGLDYKMLGKFFSGLSQSGSWCCFDEFNRIDLEVLSVVAQQILTIKTAKDAGALRFVFEGKEIKLNHTCGYFITMNPTYAGRVELPDNLKSLFRPVAMMVPNYSQIAEIMLFSEGFQDAKSLSGKIVSLYQLASRQLSQQDHYDFGMRAIKSVLVMAGHGRLHAQQKADLNNQKITEKEEAYILIHSLRDANLPKFLAEDVPLFENILADLFPGVTPPEPDHGVLEKAISMSTRDQGLQVWPHQIDKVKQFYNQILVRHGVMLVGPTGGGKTAVRSILQKALVLLPTISPQEDKEDGKKGVSYVHNRAKKGHCDVFTVNPKCVKLGELYGETDPNTYDWTDGLIAMCVRKFTKELTKTEHSLDGRPSTSGSSATELTRPNTSGGSEVATDVENIEKDHSSSIQTDWRWLVLDGPVDTLWVENLNTVLDDSKVLCLASGERISLAPGMRLIFEVDNLSQASPATISRCAMVYMDPVDLGWKPYVKTWLQRLPRELPDSGKRHLQALFDYSIDKGLRFFHKHHKFQCVPAPDMNLVSCLCHILSAFFDFMSKNGGFGNPDKEDGHSESTERGESRASSRSSGRTSKTKMRRHKMKKHNKIKEEMDPIHEQQSVSLASTKTAGSMGGRQYYLMKNPNNLLNLLGKLYVFAYTWSVGGNFKRQEDMDEDDMGSRRGQDKVEKELNICNEFDNFMREMFEVEPPLGVRLPTGNRTIYSYFIDMESGGFVPWDVLVPSTKSLIEKGAIITIGETMGVSMDQKKSGGEEQNIVPTVDVIRFSFLTSLLLLNKHPVLITGESGVGKSAVINYTLKKLCKEGGTSTKSGTILGSILNYSDKGSSLLENISNLTKWGNEEEDKVGMDVLLGAKPRTTTGIISSMIQFSAQTTSARLQAQIKHNLIQKGRNTLGAPKGRKVVLFVDDLNMPAPEEYGAQPPLELLRQFLELNGFYHTEKNAWKEIMDVTVVAACGPPGGGRNPVSPRLLKNFCMLAFPQPSTRSLQHIYQVQLGRFLQDGDFAQEVTECLSALVNVSISLYYCMCRNMLPTPAKSHYTFNVRDLSKVVQGMLQAHNSVVVSKDNAAQLFAHEATRVFHDRLVSTEDRTIFFQFLADNLHDYFKVKWTAEQLIEEHVIFGDFFDIDDQSHGRVYRPITDQNKIRQTLEEFYMRMNFGNTKASQMVFFRDAVDHICRAARIFSQPGGHMLLVGLDGCGKSTVAQLACFIAGCEMFKLTLQRGYGTLEFRDDLKKVFLQSGVKGEKIIFMLTDSDIVKESFLEDINCILNSGEVPDLFDNEEIDGITMDLKQSATQADIPDTRQAVYSFFIQRVKENLHVVLALSPAGGRFRQRCRMNPALINCCTIDWYDEWDDEAMLSVADVFFENAEFIADKDTDIQELKKKVGAMCVDMHKSIGDMSIKYWEEMRRHYYSTPSSYMELIRLYSKLLKENKTEFAENKNRLLVGLFKLSEANSLVGTMQDELKNLGPAIVQKQKDTEVLLAQLEKDREAVNEVRSIVEHEESIMKKETQIVQDYSEECQRDLESVIPALKNAVASLETLDKASISEIRVYLSPPYLVATVLNAVCLLFQKKPDWPTAKMMLGDPNFLKKLLQFDKNSLPDKVFHKLKKYTKHPDFNPDSVGKVSNSCKSICEWVLALEHYNEVHKMVKPKQKRVLEAQEALKLAQNSLSQKQASLKKIQEHLNTLTEKYEESVNQRESLKQHQKTTELRLQRAGILIGALADEKVRWAESVNELDFKLQGIVGDSLIASSSICYLGPFTAKYRKQLINNWVEKLKDANIPITKDYDLIKNTVDAHQILMWQNEGLPLDTHSTANALMVKKGNKWPLLIDPQGQAAGWLQSMEGSKLKIVSASDPNFIRTLESSIRVGEAMLLKDVSETLDPSLRPVLMHETFRRGGLLVIKLGDTEIEYNQNFRLYMTTSMSNPHYLPAVYIQANIINFTVTFEGLQEQLLSAVVKQERPLLESQRSELLESITNDLQFLRDLEDKSLGLLQKSEGHILDDQDLVETLRQSKGMAGEIYERIKQSKENEKGLNLARKKYLPVATRGSTLYFILADLSGIDVMYQFSLDWFQDMFTAAISGTMSIKDQQKRRSSATGSTLVGTPRRSSLAGAGRQHSSGSESEGIVRRSSVDKRIHDERNRRPSVQRKKSLTIEAEPPKTEQSPLELKKHMLKMINMLTFSIYRVVSVALFSRHQLTFSIMLATSVMRSNDKYDDIANIGCIPEVEWSVFLQGSVLANMMTEKQLAEHDGLTPMERLESQAASGDKDSKKHKTPPRWISDSMWRQCQYLDATIPAFDHLCHSIIHNIKQWKQFESHENPYELMKRQFDPSKVTLDEGEEREGSEHAIAFSWETLSLFQRLILIKLLRPDALTASCNQFVKDSIGQQYHSAGSFDLKEIYEESTAKTPLIFILSPSSDPGAQLLRFAKELRGSALHLDMISLGRGQGPKAEELIAKAQILKGRWVFLQNCHLAASWMPKLQNLVENFNRPSNDEIDPQFRLWLSSKPDPSFPISILQTGMKMTVEPPQGLKSNMLRAFGSGGTGVITEKMFEDMSKGHAWKKLLFGLCLFNSVIHERRKYGALGWNIAYEFNDSDLEVSILQLEMLLSEHKTIPWEALSYLIGGVTYGGRVTDEWDYRCLHSLLGRFFCAESLLPDYSYSPNKIYQPVKDSMSFSDVYKYIESLPNYNSPDIFGMTDNAEKACREFQAKELIGTIVSVQPRLSLSVIGSEKSSDDIVSDLASEIIRQLPQSVEEQAEGDVRASQSGSSIFQLHVKHILTKELPDYRDKDKNKLLQSAVDAVMKDTAMVTVLRQEIDRFNNLLHIIHTTMKSLMLAIKGEIIMSEPLEEAYDALLSQKVPSKWKSASYESRKPLGSWISNLYQRIDFFGQWAELMLNSVEKLIKPVLGSKNVTANLEEVEVPRCQPYSYWLSGFFFPQGFLTGILQSHARKLGISVDSLQFEFNVKRSANDSVSSLSDLNEKFNIRDAAFKGSKPPDDGVMIFGLYIDGARWDLDECCIQDSLPGQRFSKLPEIHFRPAQTSSAPSSTYAESTPESTPDTEQQTDKPSYIYECPLYRTSERAGTLSSTGHSTNFVTAVNLPSVCDPNFWVMRGVALLCQPDE